MGQFIGKEYIPGPNDFHLSGDGTVIEPGLGKDEPTERQMARVKDASAARIEAMKAAIAEEAEQVEQKAAALDAKERELAEREAKLAEREAATKKKP